MENKLQSYCQNKYIQILFVFRKKKNKLHQEICPKDISKNNINPNKRLLKNYYTIEKNMYERKEKNV